MPTPDWFKHYATRADEYRFPQARTNAKAAEEAIMRTAAERIDEYPLTVGGFSMGGLITRYALARLETMRMNHQTALYFSCDTSHRGGVIPIGIQGPAVKNNSNYGLYAIAGHDDTTKDPAPHDHKPIR